MNYLLDTNIIIILFEGRNNEIRDKEKYFHLINFVEIYNTTRVEISIKFFI